MPDEVRKQCLIVHLTAQEVCPTAVGALRALSRVLGGERAGVWVCAYP